MKLAHAGTCVGGPLDKKDMAHWAKKKEMFAPMIAGLPHNLEHAKVAPVKLGEYVLNNYGQWIWWETPEGKAYKTLMEQAK